MAIPLRVLTSVEQEAHPSRPSMDSEASAILSYALGNHVPEGDESSDDAESPLMSPQLDTGEEDDFLKENDPLTIDYEPFLQKRVYPLFGRMLSRNHTGFESVSL